MTGNGLTKRKTPGGTDRAERHRRRCAVCALGPKLEAEINARLVSGKDSIRQIAREYGIAEQSVSGHRKLGLPSRLAAGFSGRQIAEAGKLVDQLELLITETTDVLEKARAGDSIRDHIGVLREIREQLRLFGEATRQIAPQQVQALFVKIGVQGEDELTRILEIHRSAAEAGPEDAEADCIALARWLIEQDPAARNRIAAALLESREASTLALGSTNGAGTSSDTEAGKNGH